MISKKFVLFVIVGIVCAVIDIALMQLMICLGLYYFIAATVGFFGGLAVNFLLHTNITFSTVYSHSAAIKFTTVVAINYLITLFMIFLSQEMLDSPLFGKLVSLPVVAVNGFVLSKNWVFK